MFHIGFTGTQGGMTPHQKSALRNLLYVLVRAGDATLFHHGDCIGADEEADELAKGLGIPRHIHPPLNTSKKAYCTGEYTSEPKDYRSRNLDIVQAADILFAAPSGPEANLPRSGTWMTIRMARRHNVPLKIIWPDGSVDPE